MKKTITLLASIMFLSKLAFSQTTAVSDFERFVLPADSFYFNQNGDDFTDTNATFQYDYDMIFMYWSGGFSYSNINDSTTSGYTNQYASKAFTGYNNSTNYAVSQNNSLIKLSGASLGRPVSGFYITNSTYAHNSMRDGDMFAKKFGGVTGNDPDWFKLTVRKYYGGVMTNDSVTFYLADFRFSNNNNDYILKNWQWLSLTSLGNVDSLVFKLSSSDVGAFGMNTPAYFCMDNFTSTVPVGIESFSNTGISVFPNPCYNIFNIKGNGIQSLSVSDIQGKVIYTIENNNEELIQINSASWEKGVYIVKLIGNNDSKSIRIIKAD